MTPRREDPASAAMLASLLAASPCALAVADAAAPEQPALFVNAVWQRRTGYGAAEVLGRNLRFLQAPPGAPRGSRGLQTGSAAGWQCVFLHVGFSLCAHSPGRLALPQQ